MNYLAKLRIAPGPISGSTVAAHYNFLFRATSCLATSFVARIK